MSITTLKKNWPQKLLIISPNPFISQPSPDHSPQPSIDFSYYEISGPDICSLICALNLTIIPYLISSSDLILHLFCFSDWTTSKWIVKYPMCGTFFPWPLVQIPIKDSRYQINHSITGRKLSDEKQSIEMISLEKIKERWFFTMYL